MSTRRNPEILTRIGEHPLRVGGIGEAIHRGCLINVSL